jgi:hypothetical protein
MKNTLKFVKRYRIMVENQNHELVLFNSEHMIDHEVYVQNDFGTREEAEHYISKLDAENSLAVWTWNLCIVEISRIEH